MNILWRGLRYVALLGVSCGCCWVDVDGFMGILDGTSGWVSWKGEDEREEGWGEAWF